MSVIQYEGKLEKTKKLRMHNNLSSGKIWKQVDKFSWSSINEIWFIIFVKSS